MPTTYPLADPTQAPGADLLAAMVEEVLGLYGEDWDRTGFDVAPTELVPPTGAFLLIEEDGKAVGCGGVKRWSEEIGEIKRMYVAPEGRSRGHARGLLAALEAAARDLGYAKVRLDTGARQPHARRLYESAGYTAIPDYNGNRRAAHWFEKSL